MPAVSNLKKVQQAIHKGVQEGYELEKEVGF